jgi:hypothetical protein
MNYAGPAAGAALGFIHNNLPGAYAGYQVGKFLTSKNQTGTMAANRGHRRSVSRGRNSKVTMVKGVATKRKYSKSGSRKRVAKKRRATSVTAVGFRANASAGGSSFIKRGKSVVKAGKKHVRISRKFAKKVKEVVEEKIQHHGTFKTIFVEGLDLAVKTNEQIPIKAPFQGSTAVGGALFTPTWVMYAVARLYGQATAASAPDITDATMFDRKNFTINVLNDVCHYRFRNNTNRTVSFRMYVCQSRNQSTLYDPLTAWGNALAQGVADGSVGTYANTPAATVYNLREDPRSCPQWNTFWKCDVTDVVMEPGQTAYECVKSEGGIYDMKKFYVDDTYLTYNKKGRWVFLVGYVDLVEGVGGESGRIGHAVSHENVVCETERVIKFAVPDQIGFVYSGSTASGTNQQLNKRIRKYGMENISSLVEPASIIRVDEQNPQLNTD